VVSFTPRPLYSRGKSPTYPLGRKLGEPWNRYGRRGKAKSLAPIGRRSFSFATGILLKLLVWQAYCREQTYIKTKQIFHHNVFRSSTSSFHFRTNNFFLLEVFVRRSQWARGLRHELSSLAQTLGSWLRFPLKSWMSMCVYSVFVLFCVQVAALRRAHSASKESYRLCKILRS
jgi:hypothetical protein